MLFTEINLMSWLTQRFLEVPNIEAFALVDCEEFTQSGGKLNIRKLINILQLLLLLFILVLRST
jgi:hypothetical protein